MTANYQRLSGAADAVFLQATHLVGFKQEAAEKLDAEETERFGETKQFIRQQVFDVDGLLK